jgi:hypothetical protein
VMRYLMAPVIGLLLGGVTFLLANAVFIALNLLFGGGRATPSGGMLAIQVLLGFAIGFRQRTVFDLVAVLVQRTSPPDSSQPG